MPWAVAETVANADELMREVRELHRQVEDAKHEQTVAAHVELDRKLGTQTTADLLFRKRATRFDDPRLEHR